MAIIMILEVPGGTIEQYAKANDHIGMHSEADAPTGLIRHTCAVTDDGILVVDVWDSQESLDAFFHAKLGAALAASGMPQAQPRILPVHRSMAGPA